MPKFWILYRGNENDSAMNFGIFSSKQRAEKALKIFAEFENLLYIEDFEVDDLEKMYVKVGKDKIKRYNLYKHKIGVVNLSTDWKVYPPDLDSFIYHANDKEENFIFQNDWMVDACIYAKSEQEAVEIADKLLEELGDKEYLYA